MKKPSELLAAVREQKPLVHHLTNWVTIYDCANMTRAMGALPVMAHAAEEVEEMAGIAQALVLNIGTLTIDFMESMIAAGKAANRKGIPVVLDAVGAGATRLRTEKSLEILGKIRVSVLKGNASEIGVLAGVDAETKGVESMGLKGDPVEVARSLAKDRKLTVAITGAVDIVTDGVRVFKILNGHEMMGNVVGTGCMAGSVIGAFCAVADDMTQGAAFGLAAYGFAGEIAARESKGPGTFRERFFDAAFALKPQDLDKGVRIQTL